jgi:uncharacterized protein YukE
LNRKAGNAEPHIFTAELEKFSKDVEIIHQNLQDHQCLLQDLGKNWEDLIKITSGKAEESFDSLWDKAIKDKRSLAENLKEQGEAYFGLKDALRFVKRY